MKTENSYVRSEVENISELSFPSKLASPNEVDTFQRYEDKYLLNSKSKKFDDFMRLLKMRMTPQYPDPSTRFTLIENTYFDTRDLYSFRSHFLNINSRYKLRARRYAPNGGPFQDSIHLELKEKKEGISRKQRFQIDEFDFIKLIEKSRLVLSDSILQLNSHMMLHSLQKRIKRINKKFLRFPLKPHLVVSYRREAFAVDDLRVTIDENINFKQISKIKSSMPEEVLSNEVLLNKSLLMSQQLLSNSQVIIEVKHSGEVQGWLKDLLASTDAFPVSLSKYCVGVMRTYRPEGI